MNEFLEQFLTESRELVDQATDDLAALGQSPGDAARFDDAFRAFHTLKGGAGIVAFDAMVEALHCAETVLATSRAASRPVSALDIDNCLMCLDQVVDWLDVIESTGAIPADADAAIVVARFAGSGAALPAGQTAPAARAAQSLPAQIGELLEAQVRLLDEAGERAEAGLIASAGLVAANVLRYLGESDRADAMAAVAAASAAEGVPRRLREAVAAALDGHRDPLPFGPRKESRSQTLRVTAERIDALVRLTGELTIAKNAIGHAVKLAEQETAALAGTLKNRYAALERLVGELQRSVLGMRVLPLRVVFQRFPRLIREMSDKLHKPATLLLEGETTEVDKAVVEVLVEPLMHVLRNAMVHGIEETPVRSAAGKPAVATIRVRAFRDGELVMIEVTDDGAGVDVARVREVARERNMIAEDALASMNDAEVIDLIFAPGVSTATEVTELSGRGVGMDAVRTSVGRLGGSVEASTVPGKGTTVRFTLPFSVMMTEIMTVEAGGQTFGIPLDAVVELIRVPQDAIFPVGGAHAIVLRERTIPLVRLAGAIGAGSGTAGDEAGPIVVASIDGELGALQVDRVGERMEVMLKPLDGLLSGLPGIAGSTLLGDGSVLLILDLAAVLR